MRWLFSLLLASAGLGLTACASVISTKNATDDRGLVYYMPMRDIVITVTNLDGKLSEATVAVSVPYADRRVPYLLEYQRHPLAKNTLDVEIDEAGLLTNSKSNQTGDAVSGLGALGALGGFVRGAAFGIQGDAPGGDLTARALAGECSATGVHTFVIPITAKLASGSVCSGSVLYKVDPMGWERDAQATARGGDWGHASMSRRSDGEAMAGVFYRMNLPYRVTLSMADGFHAQTVVFSPSESREYFLPVARTFFANNDARITLAHGAGVPSNYFQDTEGEVAALLTLPAAIVAPYFEAIGQVLAGVSSTATAENAARESAIAAQLGRLKYEACLKAVQARDSALIASLQCGGA